ncbi:MAG: hypothetical protein QXX04_00945 [Candidatus Aenigmatarchaeota archaeon]
MIIIVLILTIGSIITLYLYFGSHDSNIISKTETETRKTVKSIAAGYDHTCALLSNGSVMCWGKNNYGQLGDGTYAHRFTPAPVQLFS